MALNKAVLDGLLGTTTTAGDAKRVVDALCGLAGMETVADSTQRTQIATDALRALIQSQVQAWEQMVAQRASSVVAPIGLG